MCPAVAVATSERGKSSAKITRRQLEESGDADHFASCYRKQFTRQRSGGGGGAEKMRKRLHCDREKW